MKNENNDDMKKDIRKMLKTCNLKNPEWEEQLFRLFSMAPLPEEKKKWQELGIWKRGKVIMDEEEMENLSVTFALWHLALHGILKRSVRE